MEVVVKMTFVIFTDYIGKYSETPRALYLKALFFQKPSCSSLSLFSDLRGMSGISLSEHFVLQIIETRRVNLPQDFSYVMMNLPVLVLSLTLNTWAVIVILGKERSRLNMFLVLTCLVKIVYMSLSTLGPSSLPQPAVHASVRHNEICCALEALVLLSLGLVDR